ncbi:MAG: molybdopterin molybdotransferase MoeA [Hydrogenibacillus sp.]|nr:molybdopterin molybdotransferase MoeA [Hydrogenibacillus sp.]
MDFFRVLSVAEVHRLIAEIPRPALAVENVPLSEARGRVLASPVVAPEDVPGFSRSTVDGYAVRARETFGAGESLPALLDVVGEVPMGRPPDRPLREGEAMYIPTGGMLPDGADAVVKVEHVEAMDSLLNVYRPVSPGQNVIFRGEDALAGEPVLAQGTVLRPYELAFLASLGISRVDVYAPLSVYLFSTGDELVPYETKTLRLGQVRDTNALALRLMVEEAGARASMGGIIPDEEGAFVRAVEDGLHRSALVILSGGSSVGVRDLTLKVLEERFQADILFHGISLHPGKPTLLARVGERYVLGLPGNPASALVVFFLFGLPLLARLAGEKRYEPTYLKARTKRPIASVAGRTDYYRVRLHWEEGAWWAEPVLGKSGLLFTLVGSDGLMEIPAEKEGLLIGEEGKVYLLDRRRAMSPPLRLARDGRLTMRSDREEA